MTMLARIEEEQRGSVSIARVHGEIDASNARWLGTRLRGLLSNRSDALAVDLTPTTYLDSAGIALLFELADEMRLHQQQLRLVVDASAPVARMVHISGLDQTATTYASLDDAVGG